MTLHISEAPTPGVEIADLAKWRGVPSTVVSDELNRAGAMAEIKPLLDSWTMVGPAMTVRTTAADNLALHYAVERAPNGVVLVVDAGGFLRNAVWGGILHYAAERRGLAGVVIDGAVRDVAELRKSSLPCFARGIVPAGPHKGWGGEINGPIQAGGCPVHPGDLVIGDADGVVIVPAAQTKELLGRAQKRMEAEREILRRVAQGESTVQILGLALTSAPLKP